MLTKEIKHIFEHADEAVVSRLLELIWVDGDVVKLFVGSNEEADICMIYHPSIQDSPVVISANDSDVFFLRTYACALDNTRQ